MSERPPPTQYDNIGLSYESMKRFPAALLERRNLHATLKPYISGAAVLDLACGTGYYSRLLLEWGASRVVGLDISSKMIEVAQEVSARLEESKEGRLRFYVGDAARPLPPEVMDQGPFDLVLGVWLLNYAFSTDNMSTIFANISLASKPSGVFVGVTPHPARDLDAFAALHATAEEKAQMRKFGASVEYLSPLESGEGYNARITGHTLPQEIIFENFHLRRECYEQAAGRLGGKLEWKDVQLPDPMESSEQYGVQDLKYWDGYEKRPHFGILIVEKGGVEVMM